jgi:hypothetical protein
MPSWLSGGAAMSMGGLLFMGVTVFGVLRRKAGNVIARVQYPGLAAKLGLQYTPAAYKNGVGRLTGTFKGFRVIVDPDDQRRIFVAFENAPPVELHSFVHNKRSGQGQQAFRPSSKVLAKLFKTSHASADLIEALDEDADLSQRLKSLSFVRELKTLSVTPSGVSAIFDFGNPPYIPSELVDDVLPRLVALASVLEPASVKAA